MHPKHAWPRSWIRSGNHVARIRNGRIHKLERHMQMAKQYRHNAEVCLKLASQTKEIYAKMALIDLATEFRALAEDLEHLPQSL
jgi:hypothetical protein